MAGTGGRQAMATTRGQGPWSRPSDQSSVVVQAVPASPSYVGILPESRRMNPRFRHNPTNRQRHWSELRPPEEKGVGIGDSAEANHPTGGGKRRRPAEAGR